MTNSNKLFFIILLISVFQIIFVSNINASKVIYSNDFESDQSGYFPSNWEVKRNFQWDDRNKKCMSGSIPAEWKVASISGSKRAGIALSGPYCQTEIIPTNIIIPDVSNYQYEVDMTFFGSASKDRNIAYRYNNGEEWYGLKFTTPTTIEFYKIFNNSPWDVQYRFVNYAGGFRDNTTYRFKIITINNVLQFFVNNTLIHTIPDVDPVLNSGTIALQASIGGLGANEVYFDNIVVTDLSEPPKPLDYVLNTPFFSQLDPLWKNTKYDHSQWWAGKSGTIGRWGCALTSAAMILRDNGYVVGPDNQETNPKNLNTYLIKNASGYNKWGVVNWSAITQYAHDTKVAGKVPADTKDLEYSYLSYNHNGLMQWLDASHSSILKVQMAGRGTSTTDDDGYHFVVAKGYTNPDHHILLNDPLSSTSSGVTLEASYSGKPAISMIQFKPSNTDLSYLWFMTESANSFTVTKDGQPIQLSDDTYYLDGGITDGTGGPSPSNRTLALPKPESGKYVVTLSSPTLSFATFETALFDQEARQKHQIANVLVGPNFPRTFTITYNHDDISKIKIKPYHSIYTLRQLIDYAHRNKWLRGDSYAHLKKILVNFEWFEKHRSPQSKSMLRLCDWYLPVGKHLKWIDPQAEELIHAELEGLLNTN